MIDLQLLSRRLGTLASFRSGFERIWQDVTDYILPFRADVVRQSKGRTKTVALDSTPTHALLLLAAGLHGMLTNPAVPWFSLRMRNLELNLIDEVQEWLQEVEKRLYMVLNNSNFNTKIHEAYIDLVGYGMAVLYVGEHETDVIYCDNRSLPECYVAENSYGTIDTLFRRFYMTARQMKERWPDSISREVREDAQNNPDKEHEVIHAVFPRDRFNPKRKDPKNLPWASVYWEANRQHLLQETGYHEFPFMVPRWSVITGEVYGRGPGHFAMPDVKVLNKIVETTLRAAQKKVDPPLLLSSDSFVAPIRLTPGGINVINASDVEGKVAAFPMTGDLGLGLEMEEQKRNQIRSIFFNDILQLAGQYMTATEVIQKTEERMRILGPVLGRLQKELLRPLIDRVFGICWRRGLLPPPPPIVQEQEVDVEYVSPLTRAQRTADMGSIVQYLTLVAQVAQFQPAALLVLDEEELLRHVAEVYGLPQRIIRDREIVAQLKQQQAEMAQQQAAAEGLQIAAKTLPALTKTVEQDSILNRLGAALGGLEGSI